MLAPSRSYLLLALLALAGCSGNELVGLHLQLHPDGGASLTARALVANPAPSPAEAAGKGVVFGRRAAVVHSQGTVPRLGELRFGDDSLQFVPRIDAAKLTVRIARNPTAGWVAALVPDKATRRELALVHDPLGKTREIGDVLRIELVLPGTVNSSSVLPTARGVEVGREANRAWLTIPVETARDGGEPLAWDITWL